MFPDLDRDVIDDVVRMKQGRYDRALICARCERATG